MNNSLLEVIMVCAFVLFFNIILIPLLKPLMKHHHDIKTYRERRRQYEGSLISVNNTHVLMREKHEKYEKLKHEIEQFKKFSCGEGLTVEVVKGIDNDNKWDNTELYCMFCGESIKKSMNRGITDYYCASCKAYRDRKECMEGVKGVVETEPNTEPEWEITGTRKYNDDGSFVESNYVEPDFIDNEGIKHNLRFKTRSNKWTDILNDRLNE